MHLTRVRSVSLSDSLARDPLFRDAESPAAGREESTRFDFARADSACVLRIFITPCLWFLESCHHVKTSDIVEYESQSRGIRLPKTLPKQKQDRYRSAVFGEKQCL
jgi:hypothetical protein